MHSLNQLKQAQEIEELKANGGGGGTPYVLPTASANVKGGVKIGSGLTMTGEVLSADAQIPSGDSGDVGKVLTKYGEGAGQYGWLNAQASYTDYSNSSSGLNATTVQGAIDEIALSSGATVIPVSTNTNSLQKVLKYMIDHGKKIAFIPAMAIESSSNRAITCGRISDTALSGDNGTIAFKDASGTKYDIKLSLLGQEIFFESVYVHLTYLDEGTYGYQLSYRRVALQRISSVGNLKIIKDSDGSNINTNTFDAMNTFFGTSLLPITFDDYLASGIDITDCIKAIYGTIEYDGTTVQSDALRIFGNRDISYVDIINKILFKGSLVINLTGSGISYPTSQAYATGAEVTDSTFIPANELNRVSSDIIEVYEEDENIIMV